MAPVSQGLTWFWFSESPGTKISQEKQQLCQKKICHNFLQDRENAFFFLNKFQTLILTYEFYLPQKGILAAKPLSKVGPKTLLSNWIWYFYQIILKGLQHWRQHNKTGLCMKVACQIASNGGARRAITH